MPHHLKTFQHNIRLFRTDPGFFPGDRDLFLNGIYPFQVGQEKPPAAARGYDYAVLFSSS